MFHVKHTIASPNVSRETLERVRLQNEILNNKLDSYVDLIMTWNRKVNLVSRDLPKSELRKHVFHSLMIQYSSAWSNDELVVVDAGSGGGLPGIPLAIASQNEFRLVDVVEKKMMVCRDIARQLSLNNVKTDHLSIEEVSEKDGFIYISKHAFKLSDFLELTSGQFYSAAIFLKGEDYVNELRECKHPLKLEVIKLSDYNKDEFFSGKYVITIFNPNEESGTPPSDSINASVRTKAH